MCSLLFFQTISRLRNEQARSQKVDFINNIETKQVYKCFEIHYEFLRSTNEKEETIPSQIIGPKSTLIDDLAPKIGHSVNKQANKIQLCRKYNCTGTAPQNTT